MGMTHFAGVDLGGTQLRMAVVSEDGRLVSELLSLATGREFGPAELRSGIMTLAAEVRGKAGHAFEALGLGTAGVLRDGKLQGTDVVSLVQGAAECPVRVENDARCFALAEARFGAGRGSRHLCGVTLGTGVGCGVVIDGKIHRGSMSEAGEVWRLPLRGSPLEDFVSGAGVVRGYLAAGGAVQGDADAAAVAARARLGDGAALSAWRSLGEDIAFLGHCIFCLIDPERLVIGGSLAHSRDLFAPALAEQLAERMARVAWAELGPAAGVIGAAALNMP
jgi:glucokinase